MEEEKYQKELFELGQSKKPFSRFTDMFPKADFEGRVALSISLEKLVFISIGVIMAMVIVYALGVESGKSHKESQAQAPSRPVKLPAPMLAVPGAQNRPATISPKNILSTAPVAPSTKPAARVRQSGPIKTSASPAGSQAAGPYTILAGSFSRPENARTAAAILAKQGLNATVTYGAPYYRVCVGSYTNKGPDAQNDLTRVRRVYKDAIIKLK